MPDKKTHLVKADWDEKFAASLDLTLARNVEWALTAIFYAGIHYVEAYLATRNWHSTDHRVRDSEIERDQNIRSIFADYSDLKNYSINARYITVGSFRAGDVHFATRYLERIKTVITPLV